jgi:hypothetical protein
MADRALQGSHLIFLPGMSISFCRMGAGKMGLVDINEVKRLWECGRQVAYPSSCPVDVFSWDSATARLS